MLFLMPNQQCQSTEGDKLMINSVKKILVSSCLLMDKNSISDWLRQQLQHIINSIDDPLHANQLQVAAQQQSFQHHGFPV